jgi:hypothetical protein
MTKHQVVDRTNRCAVDVTTPRGQHLKHHTNAPCVSSANGQALLAKYAAEKKTFKAKASAKETNAKLKQVLEAFTLEHLKTIAQSKGLTKTHNKDELVRMLVKAL